MKARTGLMTLLSQPLSLQGKSELSCHSVGAVCPQDQLNKHLSSAAQCPRRSLAQAYLFACMHTWRWHTHTQTHRNTTGIIGLRVAIGGFMDWTEIESEKRAQNQIRSRICHPILTLKTSTDTNMALK